MIISMFFQFGDVQHNTTDDIDETNLQDNTNDDVEESKVQVSTVSRP